MDNGARGRGIKRISCCADFMPAWWCWHGAVIGCCAACQLPLPQPLSVHTVCIVTCSCHGSATCPQGWERDQHARARKHGPACIRFSCVSRTACRSIFCSCGRSRRTGCRRGRECSCGSKRISGAALFCCPCTFLAHCSPVTTTCALSLPHIPCYGSVLCVTHAYELPRTPSGCVLIMCSCDCLCGILGVATLRRQR